MKGQVIPGYVSLPELARKTRLSRQSAWQWVKIGGLTAHMLKGVFYVRAADAAKFLAQRKRKQILKAGTTACGGATAAQGKAKRKASTHFA